MGAESRKLFYVKNSSIKLTLEERRVLIGFAIVFLIYFLGMINSDDVYNGFKKLGKFSYFLLRSDVDTALATIAINIDNKSTKSKTGNSNFCSNVESISFMFLSP
jgi:hypothetical protein